ncbi:MAG: transglycosylase domain-containing protein [Desulfobacteraceae bacterium]|nr:MAG: transglycosylase domain-containing protein [Desulfobacteraceae bacterium]
MSSILKTIARATAIVSILFFICLMYLEMRSSRLQAHFFSRLTRKVTYELVDGPSHAKIKSPSGPYDTRLGYVSIPAFSRRLEKEGYVITRQARCSETMREWTQKGLFPTYEEKAQTGLVIRDRNGEVIYSSSYPRRIFASFSEIPRVIVDMLLFIENRGLLNPDKPSLNPAVDWRRLAKAFIERCVNVIHPEHPTSGGSTLATQMEKFRHSEGGRTGSVQEKLRQIVSASLRAYSGGPETFSRRQQIVLGYLNSVPLAAVPGYGEILGLGDGLWAWYGVELDQVVAALRPEVIEEPAREDEQALRVKQVLSLLLAQGRPAYYLTEGLEVLSRRCNAYLHLLAEEEIIPVHLKKRAVRIPLIPNRDPVVLKQMTLPERQSADPARMRLLDILHMNSLYELDRLDLSVRSTLDLSAQREVTDMLLKLEDTEWLAEKGLNRARLLEKGSSEKVTYAFTMYEKTPSGNLLRIQTSNSRKALNINEDTMLDLGSTAKLRTLIHYLEIITSLYDQYKTLSKKDLTSFHLAPKDIIRQWVLSYLLDREKVSVEQILRASMQRQYSANPDEWFFTGAGMHKFENFDDKHDNDIMSVREGFLNSVNLVFIRLMRDIVHYHIYGKPGFINSTAGLHDPVKRKEYLSKFASFEGAKFLRKFYFRYKNKPEEEILGSLLESVRPRPRRIAVMYRFVHPENGLHSLDEFLKNSLAGFALDQGAVERLYRKYSPERLSLSDAGYIAGVHPLELWLASYLLKHPKATWDEILYQSEQARQEAYSWLFRTSKKRAQNKRIQVMLEIEAFEEIHTAWKRLGYPFGRLIPSYATAIGTSADRPGSLAVLMGIILNDGIKMPSRMIMEMRFASGTPYEIHFALEPPGEERVMRSEIARVVRESLLDVVRSGTARRLALVSMESEGTGFPLGGKTGTGDHRHKVFSSSGHLISSKVMDRTATFAFILGDRYFGAITAFVSGSEASQYGFTSALPVNILKLLVPALASGMRSETTELSSDLGVPGK